jgi:hypothetical protein
MIPVRHYNKFTGTFKTFITCAKTYNYAQKGPRHTLATKNINRSRKRRLQIRDFFLPLFVFIIL